MSARSGRALLMAALILPFSAGLAYGQPPPAWVYEAPAPPVKVDRSERRTAADVGALSMMTPASRNTVLSRISGDRVYDLSVQYFIGPPSWHGTDDLPPIVARAVLIDVAGFKKVNVLPDTYRITRQEFETTLAAQRVSLRPGDIVLIRGGKITEDAARWLADTNQAMIIGGDYLSLELYRNNPNIALDVPVHKYLLRDRGIAIIQIDNLDELARDRVYEFAFVAAALRPRGAGMQFRPLAFPLKP